MIQVAYCVADVDRIKHAALFHDCVVAFPLEAANKSRLGEMHTSQQIVDEIYEAVPRGTFESLMGKVGYAVLHPNEFGMEGHKFRAHFLLHLILMYGFARQIARGERVEHLNTQGVLSLEEFGMELVVATPEGILPSDEARIEDVTVSLDDLRLIDVRTASWEQITEIRESDEARNKLRNLRLFFEQQYTDKDRTYIEDDLAKRLDDYQNVAKEFGFETVVSTLTMVTNSTSLLSFGTAAFVAALAGESLVATGAAATGVSIELAKVSLEVARSRHAFNKFRRDHELAYVIDARAK